MWEEEAQEEHCMRSVRLSVPPSPHSFLPAANREQSGSPARKSMQIFLAWEENRSGTARGGGGVGTQNEAPPSAPRLPA